MSDTDNQLERFFSELNERCALVAGYEAKVARFTAPRFNVFDHIDPDENKITDILGDLLNPRGRHCQGSVFLESFLETIGFTTPRKDLLADARVRTEDGTQHKRRIDLTVTIGTGVLGLENKIGAKEQVDQVGDYIQHLRKVANENWFFVFLTPSGKAPEECGAENWSRLKEDGKALSLSYPALSSWLQSCESLSSSDRVRALIHDVANWTKNLRGGSMTTDFTKEVILEFVKRNPDYLRLFLTIQDTPEVRKTLISDFAKSLEHALMAEFPEESWEFAAKISESDLYGKEPGILIRSRSWPTDCKIGIEAERLDKPFCYGLAWPSAPETTKRELQKALAKLGSVKSSSYWPWYAYVPRCQTIEVKNWDQSETIEAMHGSMKLHLIQHFVDLFTQVRDVAAPITGRFKNAA